jgi:hypothetical protein
MQWPGPEFSADLPDPVDREESSSMFDFVLGIGWNFNFSVFDLIGKQSKRIICFLE